MTTRCQYSGQGMGDCKKGRVQTPKKDLSSVGAMVDRMGIR